MSDAGGRTAARMRAVLFLIAAAAAAAMTAATSTGIGVSNDTVQYFDCARNLSLGRGYVTSLHNYYHPLAPSDYIRRWRADGAVDLPLRPEVQFPPLYPALLALLNPRGGDFQGAARAMGIFLFAFNIFWTGLLVFRFTRRSCAAAVSGAIFMAAAEGMLDIHSAGYAEPLFIALSLIGLTLLSKYFENGRLRPLLFGAAVLGLSYGAKYTGGMLIVSCSVGFLAFGPGRAARRVRDTAVFLAAAGILPALLMIRNLLVGGDAANRIVGLRNVVGPFLAGVGRTWTSWAAPGAARIPAAAPASIFPLFAAAGAAAAAVLAAAAARVLRNRGRASAAAESVAEPPPPYLFLVYPPVYVLLFLAAAVGLDENLIPDGRLFAPIFPAAVIGVLYIFHRARGHWGGGRMRKAASGLAFAYLAAYALAGLLGLKAIRDYGRGYAGEFWRRSDVAAAVELVRARPGFLIFTNDDTAIRHFAGRSVCFVPFGRFLRPDPALLADLDGVPALFVYWKSAAHARAERKYTNLGQDAIQAAAVRTLKERLLLDGPDAAVFETPDRR